MTEQQSRHFRGFPPIVPPNGRYHGGNPLFPYRDSYSPWYDDKTDFNTNAKSYYDYLGRFNGFLYELINFINRLADRNIKVHDTPSIDFHKDGDWWENEAACHYVEGENWEDLSADVIISKASEKKHFDGDIGDVNVPNGTTIKTDGVWSPDYYSAINQLATENKGLKEALQKIINNLHEAGAITTNNIYNYEFLPGRHIANGNINLFGQQADGNYYIRTSNNATEGDVASGLNVGK